MSTNTRPDDLLKADQLAGYLGISRAKLYRLRAEGENALPPAIRIGAAVRWRMSTVEAWLSEQEGKSSDAA